jgi:hypothetical protein
MALPVIIFTPICLITFYLLVERRFGQAVFGDAVSHHAAGLGLSFKYGHVMSSYGAVISRGEAGRARTHNGDLLAREGCRYAAARVVFRHVQICKEAFDIVYGYRAVDQVAAALSSQGCGQTLPQTMGKGSCP